MAGTKKEKGREELTYETSKPLRNHNRGWMHLLVIALTILMNDPQAPSHRQASTSPWKYVSSRAAPSGSS